METIRDRITSIYNDENTIRIEDNVLGNKEFYTCVKHESDGKYYCMKNVYFNSPRFDVKDVSICKHIPSRFIGSALKYKHGCEYLKE
jgi:hypothetical protein